MTDKMQITSRTQQFQFFIDFVNLFIIHIFKPIYQARYTYRVIFGFQIFTQLDIAIFSAVFFVRISLVPTCTITWLGLYSKLHG